MCSAENDPLLRNKCSFCKFNRTYQEKLRIIEKKKVEIKERRFQIVPSKNNENEPDLDEMQHEDKEKSEQKIKERRYLIVSDKDNENKPDSKETEHIDDQSECKEQ